MERAVISVESSAYVEALMHAAKRSSCAVLGFLVGTHSGEGASTSVRLD
jgi:hypothetical protein